MGTQFWWFYDVMAAAVLLVCIFLSGKKGVMKGTFALVASLVSLIAAFGISNALTSSLFDSYVRSTSIKNISKHVDNNTFINSYASYLGSMGYTIVVDGEKVENIFKSKDGDYTGQLVKYVNNINSHAVESNEKVLKEKIEEGYAVVIRDIVARSIDNKYISESAYKAVLENRDGVATLIPLIIAEDIQHDAVEFMVDNYVAEAYKTFFRIIAFVVLFVVLWVLFAVCIKSFIGHKTDDYVSTGGHIGGGFIGIFTGLIVIFAVAVSVRLWTILGSNEMLFFNNEAVDKTYVFKYFYQLSMKI